MFKKGPNFSTQRTQQALSFCREYFQADLASLIMEKDGYLVVWLEIKQPSQLLTIDNSSPVTLKQSKEKIKIAA